MSSINFKENNFAVIGLGDTGVSIIRYLEHKKANLVKVFDTRKNPPHQDLVNNYQLYCGELALDLFKDVDIIVVSPGVSIYEKALQLAIKMGKQVINDLELFAEEIRAWNSKVVGITGSNGKTTVTSLTGHLAKAYGLNTLVCGNIGTPPLDSYLALADQNPKPEVIVLELSSFQLESSPNILLDAATTLNISADHMDRYRDLLEYAYVKANIFNGAKVQVLNRDDLLVSAMSRNTVPQAWFGADEMEGNGYSLVTKNEKKYLVAYNREIINCDELSLIGVHNYLNCLASLALLEAIEVDIFSLKIKEGLISFKPPEHRMQKVTTYNGITYIEDSKGTNVGAVLAGVSGLDKPVHLILGGDGKGQDFTPLLSLVSKKCKSVAIIGKDRDKIQKVLSNLDLPIMLCDSLNDAVKFCIQNAGSNEYVVLSPACASWDMFTDYKHRAQVFIDSVYENIK